MLILRGKVHASDNRLYFIKELGPLCRFNKLVRFVLSEVRDTFFTALRSCHSPARSV